jgi:hypothetical protein
MGSNTCSNSAIPSELGTDRVSLPIDARSGRYQIFPSFATRDQPGGTGTSSPPGTEACSGSSHKVAVGSEVFDIEEVYAAVGFPANFPAFWDGMCDYVRSQWQGFSESEFSVPATFIPGRIV